MPDPKELRRYPRATFQTPVVAQWRGESKTGSGTVSNMSLGGCYVLTNKPAQFGEQIFIAMVHKIPEIECVVRYVDPEVGMGVEFMGVKTEVREMLDEFLQARAVAWK